VAKAHRGDFPTWLSLPGNSPRRNGKDISSAMSSIWIFIFDGALAGNLELISGGIVVPAIDLYGLQRPESNYYFYLPAVCKWYSFHLYRK